MTMIGAVTVRGHIPADKLGITLPHEHLLIDGTCSWREPATLKRRSLIDAPVALEILGEIRRDIFFNKDNLKITDVDESLIELMKFKAMGGKSIVDLSVPGIGRDHVALRKISERSGVNVICGTGWYLQCSHPAYVKKKNIDEITEIMVNELEIGIDDSGVRAGVIGEIGCDNPATEDEKKVFESACRAQEMTGAPLTIHQPGIRGLDSTGKFKKSRTRENLEFMRSNGVDLEKVYMSHMDGLLLDLSISPVEYYSSIIDEYGIAISFDAFGFEAYNDSLYVGAGGLSDRERLLALVGLLEVGYDRNIMISQDVCTKIQLRKYGGYGYAHIMEHVVPCLKTMGVKQKQIDTMIIENPKRILSY